MHVAQFNRPYIHTRFVGQHTQQWQCVMLHIYTALQKVDESSLSVNSLRICLWVFKITVFKFSYYLTENKYEYKYKAHIHVRILLLPFSWAVRFMLWFTFCKKKNTAPPTFCSVVSCERWQRYEWTVLWGIDIGNFKMAHRCAWRGATRTILNYD